MRPKTKEMIKKVSQALTEENYLSADQLAELCHLRPCSIYRIIRIMRLEGIGVLPTKRGYVLAESASQQDDVHFIRTCYGKRASDVIAIQAALPYFEKRWKSVQDRNALKSLLGPISMNVTRTKGMKILLTYKNSKGM